MSIVFALCAALCNALNVTAQHVASTRGRPRSATGVRIALELARSPLWLAGWAVGGASFVFQALALHAGELSLVQALLVSELVFGLVIRRVWLRQRVRDAAWAAAALTCVGLAAFVLIDQPHGGTAAPAASSWAAALAVLGGAAAVMTVAASSGPPRRRAALYATAAAIVWALVAALIKTVVETLSASGLGAVFAQWQVYALLAGALAGFVLVQAALHVGPLSVSQPLLVIVDPVASVILSVQLFGEHYDRNALSAVASVVAFVAMCVGVLALTRTAPPNVQPAQAPQVSPTAPTTTR